MFCYEQVASSRKAVQLAKEKLDSLICLYRKQLKMHNLEFMSVSGNTHLIEVGKPVNISAISEVHLHFVNASHEIFLSIVFMLRFYYLVRIII